jgi:hypothetical protein
MERDDLLDILEHPNPERHAGQRIFVVQREDAWLSIVPGNGAQNLRRLAVLETNAADMSFLFTLDPWRANQPPPLSRGTGGVRDPASHDVRITKRLGRMAPSLAHRVPRNHRGIRCTSQRYICVTT